MISALALREHTAQLPKVEIRKPAKFIGKNTAECIQAGLYHGYLGMIERVLDGTLREMKQAAGGRVRVIATGGLAGLFARDIPRIGKNVPDLTLHGLRLAREALRDSRVLRK